MARRPENKKYVPASALAPRATLMIAKGLENRAYNKQSKAYQEWLAGMGATVGGGGRANVPPKTRRTPKGGR